MATNITDAELQQLLSEGLSQSELTRRTGIARSTLRRRLAKLGTPQVNRGVPDTDIPHVYQGTPIPENATDTEIELHEVLVWWRERKRSLQNRDDTEHETQRQTYHVQKRYIEAIKQAAELEGVSIMEIVNRAFKQYFRKQA